MRKRIVEAMGGKCATCGYDACSEALECHQLGPEHKDFTLGAVRVNVNSWATVVARLRSCVLLCSNCHREVHAGLRQVPADAPGFNEEFEDYRARERRLTQDPCPVCGTLKDRYRVTCSRRCAGKQRGKVDWDNVDLEELKKSMSTTQIAESLGVSETAVRGRLKRLKKTPRILKPRQAVRGS